MKLHAWYERSDRNPRVAIAQLFMWLSCAGALYGLTVLALLSLTGHPAAWSAFIAEPARSAFTLLVLALYIASATFIGQRRAAGGLIALTLFGSMLLEQAWRGQIVSLSSAWAVLGIVLILRAGRALGLPFFASAR
ncbi:MAG: hypothetical protein ABI601_21225 [bacterium]